MRDKCCRSLASLCLILSSFNATAELFFNTNTLTYQQGNGFKVGDDEREIATVEHASDWLWGDIYAFYDRINEPNFDRLSYYYEISPRLSFKAFGLAFESGIIKDILIATTLERGSQEFEANLIGPGITWNLPTPYHIESNIYYRNNPDLAGNSWQFTTAWAIPFTRGHIRFLFDGYIDARQSEGVAVSDVNFNSQFKVDLGAFAGNPDIIYTGVEYYHWNNKFGIDGVDERTVSLIIQARHSF